MPVVNNSLVRAGFTNINSIVTTFDSGGDSGRMRTDERGKIMAFSDYWRSLISLWDDGEQKSVWEEMLRFRDGRNRNFGNMFFQFMSEKEGNLSGVDQLFSKLTGAKINGEVVPASLEPTDVCFRTKSGKKYVGEHMMDDLRMSRDTIDEVWLYPMVKANPEVIKVIAAAEVVIICPGSMYGSVISTMLPTGIKESLQKSQSKKILITNIMSMANENHGFDQQKYVEVFNKCLGGALNLDLVIMPDFSTLNKAKLNKALKYYEMENSFPIKYCSECKDINTVVADVAIIEPRNMRLRHSENKLSILLKNLIK